MNSEESETPARPVVDLGKLAPRDAEPAAGGPMEWSEEAFANRKVWKQHAEAYYAPGAMLVEPAGGPEPWPNLPPVVARGAVEPEGGNA